jgi:hypothetical protein
VALSFNLRSIMMSVALNSGEHPCHDDTLKTVGKYSGFVRSCPGFMFTSHWPEQIPSELDKKWDVQ